MIRNKNFKRKHTYVHAFSRLTNRPTDQMTYKLNARCSRKTIPKLKSTLKSLCISNDWGSFATIEYSITKNDRYLDI